MTERGAFHANRQADDSRHQGSPASARAATGAVRRASGAAGRRLVAWRWRRAGGLATMRAFPFDTSPRNHAMPSPLDIVSHTPIAVWIALAVLVMVGARQMRT